MKQHEVRAVLQQFHDDLEPDGPSPGPLVWQAIIRLRAVQPDTVNDMLLLEALERLHERLQRQER